MLIDIAFAADPTQALWFDWTKAYSFDSVIKIIIALVVFFSALLAVIFIIWWWVMLILSWWKEEKTKPAINSIRYAVIGLIIIVLSIAFAPRIWTLLWLNIEKYISLESMTNSLRELWWKITGSSDTINFDSKSTTTWDELPADFSDL